MILGYLIWAAVVLIPVMTALCWVMPAVRRAIGAWEAAHTATAAERDAGAQQALITVQERRFQLTVRNSVIGDETAREVARLQAETAQFEMDAKAAQEVLPEVVEARRKALAARADAEAALAPEVARHTGLTSAEELAALGKAYAVYCEETQYTPDTFEKWLGDFRGLNR